MSTENGAVQSVIENKELGSITGYNIAEVCSGEGREAWAPNEIWGFTWRLSKFVGQKYSNGKYLIKC